jgi:o-succinylbenzoate synthase
MRIDSIQLFRVPLRAVTSDVPARRFESVFVVLRSGDYFGNGETTLARGPLDCEEWSVGAFACIRDWLAPELLGRSFASGEKLQEALRPFQGNHHAKAALDIAWWNLAAHQQEKPLYRLLGGTDGAIPLNSTLGAQSSIEELLKQVGEAFQIGCQQVTLKFRPGWDLEMVRAVRQAFPTEPISIDCDGLCTLGQQEIFFRLEDFFLHSIEQPFAADDLVAHAMLQQSLRTPIVLDQSITSLSRVEQAIDLQSCRQVRIDPGRVGGLTPALEMLKVCEVANIPCAVGGGPQHGVAAFAAAALATVCQSAMPMETLSWQHESWFPLDNTTFQEMNSAGKLQIRLPDDIPGLGCLLDTDLLGGRAVEKATIS